MAGPLVADASSRSPLIYLTSICSVVRYIYFIPFEAELALRAEEALEKSLKVEIDAMAKDADRLEGLVARAQAAIDKRQNVIELRQQQLADLGRS